MGYYIETDDGRNQNKREWVENIEGAVSVESPKSIDDHQEGNILICVVVNGLFDAIGVPITDRDFEGFNYSKDVRPKFWFEIPLEKAIELNPELRTEFS